MDLRGSTMVVAAESNLVHFLAGNRMRAFARLDRLKKTLSPCPPCASSEKQKTNKHAEARTRICGVFAITFAGHLLRGQGGGSGRHLPKLLVVLSPETRGGQKSYSLAGGSRLVLAELIM